VGRRRPDRDVSRGDNGSWGIGYEELNRINPRLIFTSITAMASSVRKANAAYDYDNVSQARSGIQYQTEKSCLKAPNSRTCHTPFPPRPARGWRGMRRERLGPWVFWRPFTIGYDR